MVRKAAISVNVEPPTPMENFYRANSKSGEALKDVSEWLENKILHENANHYLAALGYKRKKSFFK